MAKTVEISHKNIFFTVALLLGLYLIFLLRDVIFGLFVSVLFATALNPLVNKFEKLKLPRPVAILIIYSLIIAFLVLLFGTLLPPLIDQTLSLINSLPVNSLTSFIAPFEVNLQSLEIITNQLGSVAPIFRIVTSTFSGLIAVFTFMVITFYLLIERKQLPSHVFSLLGDRTSKKEIADFIDRLEHEIGGWIRGQLLLMLIVGFLTYIGLSLLKIPYALPLAILAGLFEIVPNIGPVVSSIPAILAPLLTGQHPFVALFVVALYIIIQQLENNLIVPKVMQTTTGVHPLITIVLIIIGLKLMGVAGAIIAVPSYIVAVTTYRHFVLPRQRRVSN